ncbi:alpha/beta fold hydrolase [Marinigracilibium pacificum]|uniref:Proline iminopeptidase n=1 Tax=Marinigracilibium pacificum TaxID=2729599 RepID=A0A848J225_9BACT|nr:alpha/beta fold hydrolase [Marinigracilibium pacificum]NMM48524.1 alpha/beta hydrolase [Marinigracilibium pacificum]
MSRLILLIIFVLTTCNFSNQQAVAECPFTQAEGIECGSIVVPANYKSATDNDQITLQYYYIHSTSEIKSNYPLVFLQGGPGGSATDMVELFRNSPYRNDFDIVLIDQRGTGLSEAFCPEIGSEYFKVLAEDLTSQQESDKVIELARACRTELENKDYNYLNYSTSNTVDDLERLREHLNIDKLNLIGGSYGTKVALKYIEKYPESTNKVVLQGIFPPEVNLYDNVISNYHQAIRNVFKLCEQDEKCKSRYPDLSEQYYSTIKRLRNEPLRLDYQGSEFVINAQDFILITHLMLYQRSTVQILPYTISQFNNNEYVDLENVLRSVESVFNIINLPVYWSVMSQEEFSGTEKSKLLSDLEKNEELYPGHAFFLSDPEVLEFWANGNSINNDEKPVESEVPVLLVNGGYDPITSVENMKLAEKGLTNSIGVAFNFEGHSIFTQCFYDLALQFLNSETSASLNTSCAKVKPTFDWR